MPKNEDLQKQTLRVLSELGSREKPLSARAAGEKLNIGYNQIADMAKGKAPGEKTLIKFARALSESPADWLRYAGKSEFAKTLEQHATPEHDATKRIAVQIAQELSCAPKETQTLLLRQIRALIRATLEEAPRV